MRTLANPSNRPALYTVAPALRAQMLVVGAAILVSVALRLATWDPIADGGYSRYARSVAFGAFAAAAVWGLVLAQTASRSRAPVVASLVVLLAGDAVHYLRLAHPISRGAPVQAVQTAFTSEEAARRSWDIGLVGGGRAMFEGGALRLESPPNGSAYIEARLGPLPSPRDRWWLPVALADQEPVERFRWRASVDRTGSYYVVAESRRLLIQVVPYGLHITYPEDQKTTRGYEVPHPVGADGKVYEWDLTRDRERVSLALDGKQVWSAPQREPMYQAKLGETKVDPLHGGAMRIERADYTSSLARR